MGMNDFALKRLESCCRKVVYSQKLSYFASKLQKQIPSPFPEQLLFKSIVLRVRVCHLFRKQKTFSCPLVHYFCIRCHDILG